MSASTRRRSITKTHERISQLGWEPGYHRPAVKYPTRYTFPTKAKDPMKHIMREYLPMELEKDERVYGGHDAAVRAEMTSKTELRWLEVLKPFIVATAYAEVGAGRCMSMLIDAVPNNELRNGYHVQFVDEIRHTGLQMALARWYAKHVPDPAGWHLGPKRSPTWPSWPCRTSRPVTATSRCRRPTSRCSRTRRATSRTGTRRCSPCSRTTATCR
jgi:propane monooxygenase large subunit